MSKESKAVANDNASELRATYVAEMRCALDEMKTFAASVASSAESLYVVSTGHALYIAFDHTDKGGYCSPRAVRIDRATRMPKEDADFIGPEVRNGRGEKGHAVQLSLAIEVSLNELTDAITFMEALD